MQYKVRVNSTGGLLINRDLKKRLGLSAGDDIDYRITEVNGREVYPALLSGNVTKIGGSLMVVVPKKRREKLGLKKGDIVTIKILRIRRY